MLPQYKIKLAYLLITFFLVMENQQQKVYIDAHPLFFDSLFPSFQSTTPETVISDYRQRKRADSRAEHDSNISEAPSASEMKKFSENNVEFYAEIIGKLIGTIRNGITSLVDDVRQRKMAQGGSADVDKQNKSEMLKTHRRNETNELMDTTGLHQTVNGIESNQTKVANEAASDSEKKIIHVNDATKERQEIKLATAMERHDESSESNGNEKRVNERIQSGNESAINARNAVVQVIARQTKYKRSDKLSQKTEQERDGYGDDKTYDEQLAIPIDSALLDSIKTNDLLTAGDDDQNGNSQHGKWEREIIWASDDEDGDEDEVKWYQKHQKSIENIRNRHRNRTEKFFKFIHKFLAPLKNLSMSDNSAASSLTASSSDNHGDTLEDGSKLSFAIMRGNSTIIHLTPKQFLRTFHRGSDEHADLQLRAKQTFQRAFYRYARIYLLARKGYKEARSFNRIVKKNFQENDETNSSDQDFQHLSDELNQEDDEEQNDSDAFMTSDARNNFQAIEGFAIFILEIFGTVLALTIGAISHLKAGMTL